MKEKLPTVPVELTTAMLSPSVAVSEVPADVSTIVSPCAPPLITIFDVPRSIADPDMLTVAEVIMPLPQMTFDAEAAERTDALDSCIVRPDILPAT